MNGVKGHVTVTTQNGVDTEYPLADIDMRACMGLQAIMQTIMMGKMEIVLPDMYMMKRFIGICFRGPRATSQQRCKIKTSNSDSNDSSQIEMETKRRTDSWLLTFSTRFLSVSWMLVSGTGFSE